MCKTIIKISESSYGDNICKMLDIIEDPIYKKQHKLRYIEIYEWCQAEKGCVDLKAYMVNKFHKKKKFLKLKKANKILLQLSKGLNILHLHGIMHRDLKPDNVILAR